jgi:TRAP-type C4-dicarboxylate transport system permease small subunit
MTIEVVMRYFLKKPLAWQLDISEFVLVTVAMLAAGYTQAVDGHVKVTVLVSRFSETKRLFFRIMALVLSLGFLIPFTFYAWGAALTAIERGDSTGGVYEFPLWPVKMIMAVGLSLLCVQVIFQLCQVRLRGKPTKSAGKI